MIWARQALHYNMADSTADSLMLSPQENQGADGDVSQPASESTISDEQHVALEANEGLTNVHDEQKKEESTNNNDLHAQQTHDKAEEFSVKEGDQTPKKEDAISKKEEEKGPEEGAPLGDDAKPKAPKTPPSEKKEKKKDEISDAQRKAKIEELRKRKITDHKKKEDEKRKAVLERKRKLEEAERLKQEALIKKLEGATAAPKRPASAPARRAVSFSSLAHLKKTHTVTKEIEIGDKKPVRSKEAEDKVTKAESDRRRTLPARPMSAMERKRPGSFSSDKAKPVVQKNGTENTPKPGARPKSSIGTRVEPKMRQSISNLPPRPSSAAANRGSPKPGEAGAKTAAPKSRPSMPALPGKPLVPPTKEREMRKSKSTSTVQEKKGPIQPGKTTTDTGDKAKPKAGPMRPPSTKARVDAEKQKPSPGKPGMPKEVAKSKEAGKSKEVGKPKEAAKLKEAAKPAEASKPKEAAKPKERRSSADTPVKDGPKKAGIQNEADAKRLLAEKRKQVKEEQERKKLIEQNRLEEEKLKQEEEKKRRAEELAKEQERQKAHLEELQREAEERERKAQEEKERKEQEEREKLEAEKKQRQEEIDRKAQEEVDRRAKEREQKRQQEEADRMERKKRVQEILGSRIRSSPVSERPVSPTPFMTNDEEPPSEGSPPAIDSASSARDRVQKLLEKNHRKSGGESPNGSLDGEKSEISKPEATTKSEDDSLAMTNHDSQATNNDESRIADSLQTTNDSNMPIDDKLADFLFETESSLTEADKQALEDIENDRRNQVNEEAAEHAVTNGVVDDKHDNSKMDQQNEPPKTEEEKLWNEAEELMAESQDNKSNSIDQNGPTKAALPPATEENRLWQLVEGQLELEECF